MASMTLSKENYTYGAVSPVEVEDVQDKADMDGNEQEHHHTTVLETSANLISVITGSGMLSLPYAAANMGWASIGALAIIGSIFMYTYDLLAQSIAAYHMRFGQLPSSRKDHIAVVDYVTFGRLAFGKHGTNMVFAVFCVEMLLALVSFFIMISINLNIIVPSLPIKVGVLVAAVVTWMLIMQDLKLAASASAFGLAMTALIVMALFFSGIQLDNAMDTSSVVKYDSFSLQGVPLSVGLIAFCFGGHGAFPKIYQHLEDKSRHREVLGYTFLAVGGLYLVIMVMGYYFYAQFTRAPITLNIGMDLQFHELPHSSALMVMCALGVLCNLQATCPLLVFALEDVLVKMAGKHAQPSQLRACGSAVVIFAAVLAWSLSAHFVAICGLIGSFATMTNSVLMPICFYHAVMEGNYPLQKKLLHAGLLVIALLCSVSGMSTEICQLFTIASCPDYLQPKHSG